MITDFFLWNSFICYFNFPDSHRNYLPTSVLQCTREVYVKKENKYVRRDEEKSLKRRSNRTGNGSRFLPANRFNQKDTPGSVRAYSSETAIPRIRQKTRRPDER